MEKAEDKEGASIPAYCYKLVNFFPRRTSRPLRKRLFHDRDLPAMIETVLHDPVEQVVEVILAARNDVCQPLIGKSINSLGKLGRGTKHTVGCRLPGSGAAIGDG